MVLYVLPGEPVALSRPRTNFTERRVYNSQRNCMTSSSIHLQSQHNSLKMYDGPLHLEATFYFPYPKNFPKSKREGVNYKTTRCDLDNLIKFICDISNGILYADDATIVSISAKKVYADKPRTEFTITSL